MATLLLLLIAAAWFAAPKAIPFPKEVCIRPNEEFDECKPLCVDTCDSIYDPNYCPPGCAIGCTCKLGFVRDDEHNCVAAEKCAKNAKPIEGIYLA